MSQAAQLIVPDTSASHARGRKYFAGRRRLRLAGRLSVGMLLIMALSGTVGALFLRSPDLEVLAAVMVAGTIVVASGYRFTPVIAVLAGTFSLYSNVTNPYAVDHLTHAGSDPAFPGVLLGVVLSILVIVFGATSTIADALNRDRAPGRWSWLLLVGMLGMVVGASVVAETSHPVSAPIVAGTAHMSSTGFTQDAVVVHQYARLKLVNDSKVLHVISNGTWLPSGSAKTGAEAGAAAVIGSRLPGGTVSTASWSTPGTYHLYCLVHRGMNLTVVVE